MNNFIKTSHPDHSNFKKYIQHKLTQNSRKAQQTKVQPADRASMNNSRITWQLQLERIMLNSLPTIDDGSLAATVD
jgi:hypothetical protein